MVPEISFSPPLLITLLAFAIPILFSRIRIISMPIIVGEILCGYLIHHPSMTELLSEQMAEKNIIEVPLYGANYHGRSLKELHLPGDCLILSIKRDGEFLIPRGDTILKKGDTITILGSEQFLIELRDQRPEAAFSIRTALRRLNRKFSRG